MDWFSSLGTASRRGYLFRGSHRSWTCNGSLWTASHARPTFFLSSLFDFGGGIILGDRYGHLSCKLLKHRDYCLGDNLHLCSNLHGPASAQEEAWKVEGKLLGESKKVGVIKDDKDAKKSEDVSGLACADTDPPKICIVVDDESQGAQVVILKEGKLEIGDFIHLINNTFDDEPLELDAEAVTYADGSFYVIGSHGRPRHAEGKAEDKNVARAAATRRIFRITFKPDAVDTGNGKIRVPPESRTSPSSPKSSRDIPR